MELEKLSHDCNPGQRKFDNNDKDDDEVDEIVFNASKFHDNENKNKSRNDDVCKAGILDSLDIDNVNRLNEADKQTYISLEAHGSESTEQNDVLDLTDYEKLTKNEQEVDALEESGYEGDVEIESSNLFITFISKYFMRKLSS